MVWYSHLLKNFPQFIVIHTVKGFGIVNKAEIDVFLELSCFFGDPADAGNSISGSSAFYIFRYFSASISPLVGGRLSSRAQMTPTSFYWCTCVISFFE